MNRRCAKTPLLERCKEKQLLRQRGRARTDATAVLTSVRTLNRLELITETLRAALNELATVAPDWLREVARPEWFERYADRVEEARLPKGVAARQEYAEVVGHDGFELFKALDRPISLELSRLDAVEALRQVWLQHLWLEDGRCGCALPKTYLHQVVAFSLLTMSTRATVKKPTLPGSVIRST